MLRNGTETFTACYLSKSKDQSSWKDGRINISWWEVLWSHIAKNVDAGLGETVGEVKQTHTEKLL